MAAPSLTDAPATAAAAAAAATATAAAAAAAEAAQGVDSASATEAAAAPASRARPSPPSAADPSFARTDFAYCSCYCEENAYLLLRRLVQQGADPATLHAVFVSNEQRCVPVWRQRRSAAPDGLCVWDYHVFAAQRDNNRSLVYDLDTTVEPFPAPFDSYRREALRQPPDEGAPLLRRRYRVVPAPELFASFSSDRSHMRTPDGTGWTMPPPPWPLVGQEFDDKNALPSFLAMARAASDGGVGVGVGPGLLMDEREFVAFFSPAAGGGAHRRG
jgi:hypothetical protein